MPKATENQDRDDIGKNIQPLDPGKNQIVYMMPQQDFEEDEIDLFQLLLPPLRYKLQILIFLTVGILFGIGVLWYKTTIQSVAEIEGRYEQYQIEIKNLQEKKRFAEEDFFSALKRIKGDNPVLQIVGAQYRFSDQNDPEKVKTIEIESYKEMVNIGKTTPVDAKENFEVILRIKSHKIKDLIQELRGYYGQKFSLEEKLAALEYQKKVTLALTFIHLEEKQELLGTRKNTDDINKQIAEHRKDYLEFEDQAKEVSLELTELKYKIDYIHKTLTENVYFETTQNEIPWEVWNDIKAQTKNGEQQEQATIIKMAGEVVGFNAEISKFNLMGYIYQNSLELPLDAFNWPALKAIAEEKEAPVKKYAIKGIGKKKILIISFMIALFIGIISVYIRAFVNKAGEKGAFTAQKRELIENLKSWKL